ncbi:tyrosine-type recombinase/integrase [Acetobacterium carbinolicum]|uniref:tyrosine-type recombinase/integrase n=1 Tax=Acetobacterium carbinolicum TaxID=52690 RepID=UPI0039C977DA
MNNKSVAERIVEKASLIDEKISGYWANDEWYINDLEMQKFVYDAFKSTQRKINFSYLPEKIKNQVKFYFLFKLENGLFNLRTGLGKGSCIKIFASFLESDFPNIISLEEISDHQMLITWRNYLVEHGYKVKNGAKNSPYLEFGLKLHRFIIDYFYVKDDIYKERWDSIIASDPASISNNKDYSIYKKCVTIDSLLDGCWNDDVWNIEDIEAGRYSRNEWSGRRRIEFLPLPFSLRKEFKFFIVSNLKSAGYSNYSCFRYTSYIKTLSLFLKDHYPCIWSFMDIPYEELMKNWKKYLLETGYSVRESGKMSFNVVFISNLYLHLLECFDDAEEFAKDIWDCRKIPGVEMGNTQSYYSLNFEKIPFAFRTVTKRYIKQLFICNKMGTVFQHLESLKIFFGFIHRQYPHWNDLKNLERKQMEEYLSWYRNHTHDWKSIHITYLRCLRAFIESIQQMQYSEAPIIPSYSLIFKEDIPKREKILSDKIKYIPEDILMQFDKHLLDITPEKYQFVALFLRISGWRISDILALKYDSCLEKTSSGWYLIGNIQKTDELGHRIPISAEIAAVIKVRAEIVMTESNDNNNPDHLFFNMYQGKRKGKCYSPQNVRSAFNRMAKNFKITDLNGKSFNFNTHAFRHSKAIELINGGMDLLHVQKWMAHQSPEMTLVYAKIRDDTMRKSWEASSNEAFFRFDSAGNATQLNLNDENDHGLIEWTSISSNRDAVRTPLGYCLKPKKQPCEAQLNPCLICNNLCTTTDFIPQYEQEIKEVNELIEISEKLGRRMWVEKNKAYLHKLEDVLTVLKEGGTHHKIGKEGREYTKKLCDILNQI